MSSDIREVATLGGGCFWCLEAVLEQLRGVERVVSGYAGGHVPNPEVEPLETFYPAEAEHQSYYRSNPNQGYCRVVIAPKVAKLRSHYLERLAGQRSGSVRGSRRLGLPEARPSDTAGLPQRW